MAARPKTLTAAFVPVLVGTALAHTVNGQIDWMISLYALFGALFIQIGTNYFNDAIDFKKGADREDRLGPVRATQAGLLSLRAILLAGGLCFVIAALFGLPLVLKGGWVIVAIGLLSLLMGYAYTGGPFPLAYLGLGDLFVILFFGIVAVGGIYYLQTNSYSLHALVAGLQIGFLSSVLIAINNLRDIDQDIRANKKTLPVRFGLKFGRIEIFGLYALTFLGSLYWIFEGMWLVGILPIVTWSLVRSILKGVSSIEPSKKYNEFLARASLVQLIFSLQMVLGFALS